MSQTTSSPLDLPDARPSVNIFRISQKSAQLPKSISAIHSGDDTHIINDRSLLVSASECDEPLSGGVGSRSNAKAIGDFYLELANNLTLRLPRVRYVPGAKYDLISDHLLAEIGFGLCFGYQKLSLGMDEKNGSTTWIEVMNLVAR